MRVRLTRRDVEFSREEASSFFDAAFSREVMLVTSSSTYAFTMLGSAAE